MNENKLRALDEATKLDAVEALADLLDGTGGWEEIQENTGLPEDRCKEIYALHCKIVAETA